MLLLCYPLQSAFCQESIKITGTYNRVSLKEFLEEIENQYSNHKFYYLDEWIEKIKISGKFNNSPIDKVMDNLLAGRGLQFYNHGNGILSIVKAVSLSNIGYDNLIEKKNNRSKRIFGNPSFKPQGKVRLTGKIKDGATGDAIIGGSIYITELESGVTTDVNGDYNITLDPGEYHLRYAYIGYQQDNLIVGIYENADLSMDLYEEITKLEEVVVSGEVSDANVSNTQFGAERLSIDRIKSIPAFLGEADVVKAILLLPGVSTAGEGASGFNVRGGNVDQNLVLLDGGLIFNPSHIFGFFSSFNAEIVKDAVLYKGNIPSEYGGRASSVLDVTLIEGNKKKLAGRASAGLTTAKLALEGPIKSGKSSFVLAGRSSFSDWVLQRIPSTQLKNSSASFYDTNLKISQELGQKSRLSLSLYASNDQFSLDVDTVYNWSTFNGSILWDHIFSDKVFSSTTLSKGRYQYNVSDVRGDNQYELNSAIDYEKAKFVVNVSAGTQHDLSFGMEGTVFKFSPGQLNPMEGSFLKPITLENEKGLELAGFVSNEFNINHRFSVIAGMRVSTFSNLGPGTVEIYDDSGSRSAETSIGERLYADGETVRQYYGIEPRFSFKSPLSPTSSLKLSYGIANQYLHLISNTAAITPIDIWKMSDTYLKPLRSTQFSLGYFRNFKENTFESSAEVYFKDLDNIVEYIDHADLILNENLETDVLNAKGHAYGLELSIKKNRGRLNGWMSYTFSRSLRKIIAPTDREVVNGGSYFPSNFDKPHDLTVVGNYKISRKFSLSFNFTYSTGRPVTAPLYRYRIGNLISLDQYSERNELRIPDYHRLDVAFTIDTSIKIKRKLDSSWVISLYNLYARRNAYSVFFRQHFPEGPRKLSVIGTMFPSVTYNVKF